MNRSRSRTAKQSTRRTSSVKGVASARIARASSTLSTISTNTTPSRSLSTTSPSRATAMSRSLATSTSNKPSSGVAKRSSISILNQNSQPLDMAQSSPMTMPSRGFRARKVRWVRRGITSDRKPNMAKKIDRALASEMYFLTTPLSHSRPKGSLRDKFFRMRLQYYDQNRIDHPELNIPEKIPYEIDRVPIWWPKFETYCKAEQAKPLVFYRRMWLRYEEPSFIHVTRVQDKLRSNKYGRRTVLTAWHTWRGVTGTQPIRVKSTGKSDWMQLDPNLGMMTDEIWKKLRAREIPRYELPEPPCYDNSLEAEYLERENKRFEDIIESTRSKVV